MDVFVAPRRRLSRGLYEVGSGAGMNLAQQLADGDPCSQA